LPHLTYGILAWGSYAAHIFKLQKKAIRVIACSKYNAHTDPLFVQFKLLKVEDLYVINLLIFYFHYCHYSHDQLPTFFLHFHLKPRSDIHHFDTRNKNLLITGKIRTKVAETSLRHILPKVINETSNLIKEKIYTHSLWGYSQYIKIYLLKQYKSECLIQNCYICNQ
jgi:hypothetical protein